MEDLVLKTLCPIKEISWEPWRRLQTRNEGVAKLREKFRRLRKEFYSTEARPVSTRNPEVEEIDQSLRHGAVGEYIQLNKLKHSPGKFNLPRSRLRHQPRHAVTYSLNLGVKGAYACYIPHKIFPRRISMSPNKIDHTCKVPLVPVSPTPRTPAETMQKKTIQVTIGVSTNENLDNFK